MENLKEYEWGFKCSMEDGTQIAIPKREFYNIYELVSVLSAVNEFQQSIVELLQEATLDGATMLFDVTYRVGSVKRMTRVNAKNILEAEKKVSSRWKNWIDIVMIDKTKGEKAHGEN